MDRTLDITSRVEGRDLEEMEQEPPRSRDVGSGENHLDPRIVWTRNATTETEMMIAGIERVCREACAILGYTVIIVRPTTTNHCGDDTLIYRPHIDVHVGDHVHGDRSICEMFATGTLFYLTHENSVFYYGEEGTPDKLAQPGDTGSHPGPNPELYQFGTEMYEERCEELWDQVRAGQAGQVRQARGGRGGRGGRRGRGSWGGQRR